MNIRTADDITPEVVRQLREDLQLYQREFWEAVGSTQTSGHWFESGKRKGIPKSLRMLIFLRFVCHIEVDVTVPKHAAAAMRLGQAFAAHEKAVLARNKAREAEKAARTAAREAKKVEL